MALVALFLVIAGLVARRYYLKYKGYDKIKVAGYDLKPTSKLETLDDLKKALIEGVKLKGNMTLRNFSDMDYSLNQFSVDCLSPKGAYVAEQENILQEDLIITKKSETQIPLQYKVNVLSLLSLMKDCGVIPEDTQLWQVFKVIKNFDPSKLRVKLVGFIKAEGIDIPVNETFYLA